MTAITLPKLVVWALLFLLIYPVQVQGREIPRRITHEGREGSVSSGVSRSTEDAYSSVQKAERELSNAQIPVAPNRATSRQYEIQRSADKLEAARAHLRDEQNRLYWQQRLKEDSGRELKRIQEKKPRSYSKKFASDRGLIEKQKPAKNTISKKHHAR